VRWRVLALNTTLSRGTTTNAGLESPTWIAQAVQASAQGERPLSATDSQSIHMTLSSTLREGALRGR
jgi:hypothetical protein